MPIVIRKGEWTYDNLGTEGYNSSSMLEPYDTWLLNEAVSTESENFGVSEGEQGRSADRNPEENFVFADSYDRIVAQQHSELIIKFNEISSRHLDRTNNEQMPGFTDESTLRKVDRIDIINILFSEDDTRSFVRTTVDDKFFLWDDAVFTATNVETGEVAEGEQIEKGGSINLFDFEISPETDFDTWVSNNCPVNYGEVRPFIPGEYEYTDAYVGFTLAIPPTDGRFGVAGSTVWIDVEDTVEKGTAETKGGKLERVNFSKRFYTPPHIMTSLNYAAENCYIEVKNVTRDYFEFGLKSIASGEYLNGEINWLADGY